MPNNSCTVVLTGHGCYSKNYVIDLNNYNIIFPCGMNESISNGYHNLLLNSLTQNIQNNVDLLEHFPTSYVSNRNIQQQGGVVNMFEKHTKYIYDHGLSNAQDVRDMHSLVNINALGVQRFVEYGLTQTRNWPGTLNIGFDQIQAKSDVIQTHHVPNYHYNTAINLSRNDLICIKPTAQQNVRIEVKLSSLLDDILPKIKIPVSYHPNTDTSDILPLVFLDDNNIQNKQQIFSQQHHDIYHELVIAGDANIIWDACRDLVA